MFWEKQHAAVASYFVCWCFASITGQHTTHNKGRSLVWHTSKGKKGDFIIPVLQIAPPRNGGYLAVTSEQGGGTLLLSGGDKCMVIA